MAIRTPPDKATEPDPRDNQNIYSVEAPTAEDLYEAARQLPLSKRPTGEFRARGVDATPASDEATITHVHKNAQATEQTINNMAIDAAHDGAAEMKLNARTAMTDSLKENVIERKKQEEKNRAFSREMRRAQELINDINEALERIAEIDQELEKVNARLDDFTDRLEHHLDPEDRKQKPGESDEDFKRRKQEAILEKIKEGEITGEDAEMFLRDYEERERLERERELLVKIVKQARELDEKIESVSNKAKGYDKLVEAIKKVANMDKGTRQEALDAILISSMVPVPLEFADANNDGILQPQEVIDYAQEQSEALTLEAETLTAEKEEIDNKMEALNLGFKEDGEEDIDDDLNKEAADIVYKDEIENKLQELSFNGADITL